jgi:hypothetical protein
MPQRRPGDISYHCMLRLCRLRQQRTLSCSKKKRTLSLLMPPRRWILIAWGSSDLCLAENLPAQSPTKLRGTLGTYGAGPWACHRPGYIYALHRQTPRPTRHCWNDMHMQTKFKWGMGDNRRGQCIRHPHTVLAFIGPGTRACTHMQICDHLHAPNRSS